MGSEPTADGEVKVEMVPEMFDHLHPYPDIYYESDEDMFETDHAVCDGCGADLCHDEACECDAEDFEPGI